MTDEFPNRSQRKAAEPEVVEAANNEIEKIITGEAISRKPSGFRRLRKSFIGGDATSVSEHVLWNMLVPAAKDTLAEMCSTFVEMMIFGEKRSRPSNVNVPTHGNGSTSKFNYAGVNSGKAVILNQNVNDSVPGRYNPNEIIVGTRAEALGVIERMFEILEKYNAVTVTNLYTLVGRTSSNYMDNSWGWTDLGDADVRRVRGGGNLIVLPQPKDLNN